MEESCERVSRHKTPNENSLHNELSYFIAVLPVYFTVDKELESFFCNKLNEDAKYTKNLVKKLNSANKVSNII